MSTCLQLPLPLPPTHTHTQTPPTLSPPTSTSRQFSSPFKTRRSTITLTPNAAKFPSSYPSNHKAPFLQKLSAVHSLSPERPSIFSSIISPPKPKPTPSPSPSPSSPPPEVQPSRYDSLKLRRSPPDLPSRFLHRRVVHIYGPLLVEVAELVIQELMFLQYMDAKKPIYMHIDSSGTMEVFGQEADGFAIYDFMQMMKCEIYTLNSGQANGMACLLLAAGTKGKRYSVPNATATLQQPYVSPTGTMQASDLAIHTSAAMKDKATYVKLLAKCTGTSEETIFSKMAENSIMNSESAIEFGIVDKILSPGDPSLMHDLPSNYYKKGGFKN